MGLLARHLCAVLPARWAGRIVCRRLPRFANLELTTHCNLRCPLCVTHLVPRRTRLLPAALVDDVLDGADGCLREVSFHIMGDPTAHPGLFDVVERCRARGVQPWIATNGMLVERHVDQLLSCGLAGISIDIDGADADDYRRYRRGGDFDQVVAGVRRLVAERDARGAPGPVIQLQAILFPYNARRRGELEQLFRSLGADRVRFKSPSYFFDLARGEDMGVHFERDRRARAEAAADEFLASLTEGDRDGAAAVEPVSQVTRRPTSRPFRERRFCPQLEHASVLSDGRVVACCMDALGTTTYGTLGEESFERIWRGRRHGEVVERFARGELEVCKSCTLG